MVTLVVLSDERRVEALARQAWVTRAVVRVRLLTGHRIDTFAIAGQVDD